jgi:hypothetical protein
MAPKILISELCVEEEERPDVPDEVFSFSSGAFTGGVILCYLLLPSFFGHCSVLFSF